MAYECPYCGASQANKEQHQEHVKACFEDRAAYKVKQGMKPLTEKMIQEMKERVRKERPGEIMWGEAQTLFHVFHTGNFQDLEPVRQIRVFRPVFHLFHAVSDILKTENTEDRESMKQLKQVKQKAKQRDRVREEGIGRKEDIRNKLNRENEIEVKV